jgi:hypothetical protein
VPREAVERERVLVLRAVPPAAFRVPADFAVEERALVPADLARVVLAFLVPDEARFAPARDDVARFARVLVERRAELEAPPLSALDPLSSVHLPDSTRCAASATASAIREPNFDALETTVLAAA